MALKRLQLPPLVIKRNSQEFKAVKSFISDHLEEESMRQRRIKLFHLIPGQALEEATLLNERKSYHSALYNLAFDALYEYFHDKTKKLFREGQRYYFKSSAQARWIEAPFEFAGQLKKELAPLQRESNRAAI